MIGFENDLMYEVKQCFIRDYNLVIFRFHDHAHVLWPDSFVVGFARMFGWIQYALSIESCIYVLSVTILRVLVMDVVCRLNGCVICVVGDFDMIVSWVVLGFGYGVLLFIAAVDVSVGGEFLEVGGNVEYVFDVVVVGQKKGMIFFGYILLEDFGMKEVADWLRMFFPDVFIEWVFVGESFALPR